MVPSTKSLGIVEKTYEPNWIGSFAGPALSHGRSRGMRCVHRGKRSLLSIFRCTSFAHGLETRK
jgi:hypothetical protein